MRNPFTLTASRMISCNGSLMHERCSCFQFHPGRRQQQTFIQSLMMRGFTRLKADDDLLDLHEMCRTLHTCRTIYVCSIGW